MEWEGSEIDEGIAAAAVERGCGKRKAGGVYAEVGLAEDGYPLEHFILDPPVLVPDEMHLTATGVTVVGQGSRQHVVDWVGSEFYPNVTDFLEEVRRFGLSRRLPKTFDFSQITAGSRIILAHSRAWVENIGDYRRVALAETDAIRTLVWNCPKTIKAHADLVGCPDEPCAGVWWQDVEGWEAKEERTAWGADGPYPRGVVRKMPSFSYFAFQRPEGFAPEYKLAFFASFPMTRLVVVEAEDGSHEETYARMQTCGLPTAVVEE